MFEDSSVFKMHHSTSIDIEENNNITYKDNFSCTFSRSFWSFFWKLFFIFQHY